MKKNAVTVAPRAPRILAATALLTLSVALTTTDAHAQGLLGADATARNTIQVEEPLAGAFGLPAGIEVDFVPTTDPFAIVAGATPELDSFATVYDINFNDDSVVFTFAPSDDSPVTPRVLEEGTFDRYYFNFTFADPNTVIDAVALDLDASNILPEATATPVVTLTSPTSFTVELGIGNGVLPGFVHAYSISVVPEPATATLLVGLTGLALSTRRRVRSLPS